EDIQHCQSLKDWQCFRFPPLSFDQQQKVVKKWLVKTATAQPARRALILITPDEIRRKKRHKRNYEFLINQQLYYEKNTLRYSGSYAGFHLFKEQRCHPALC